MKYVNVYLVTRHYGGPQEGGWWYNNCDLEECVPCRSELFAKRVAEHFKAGDYSNEDRRSIYSVLGDAGEYCVAIEDSPGESTNGYTPYC